MFIQSPITDGRSCVQTFRALYLTMEIYSVSETFCSRKLKMTDVHTNSHLLGRAIAQVVSRRLPTAAARVRPQVR
jgi:hypothetical protein